MERARARPAVGGQEPGGAQLQSGPQSPAPAAPPAPAPPPSPGAWGRHAAHYRRGRGARRAEQGGAGRPARPPPDRALRPASRLSSLPIKRPAPALRLPAPHLRSRPLPSFLPVPLLPLSLLPPGPFLSSPGFLPAPPPPALSARLLLSSSAHPSPSPLDPAFPPPGPPGSRSSHAVAMEAPAAAWRELSWAGGTAATLSAAAAPRPLGPGTKRAIPSPRSRVPVGPPSARLQPCAQDPWGRGGSCAQPSAFPAPKIAPLLPIPTPIPEVSLGPGDGQMVPFSGTIPFCWGLEQSPGPFT